MHLGRRDFGYQTTYHRLRLKLQEQQYVWNILAQWDRISIAIWLEG